MQTRFIVSITPLGRFWGLGWIAACDLHPYILHSFPFMAVARVTGLPHRQALPTRSVICLCLGSACMVWHARIGPYKTLLPALLKRSNDSKT